MNVQGREVDLSFLNPTRADAARRSAAGATSNQESDSAEVLSATCLSTAVDRLQSDCTSHALQDHGSAGAASSSDQLPPALDTNADWYQGECYIGMLTELLLLLCLV